VECRTRIIAINPMRSLPKIGAEKPRDRVLSDAELAAVWAAAEDWPPFGDIYRLLILTGARRDEIAALRWSEIQGDQIRLDGARTKNSLPHIIPLSGPAFDLIERLPRIVGTDFVFTTTGRTAPSGWTRAKQTLDAKLAALVGKHCLTGMCMTSAVLSQRGCRSSGLQSA
jgi:integrase